MKRSQKRLWIWATPIVLFAGLQFFQPGQTNPPVTHPIQAPAAVTSILKRACYDCHSNETRLHWYNRVAPVSWLVAEHVRTGRSRFNFSTWDTLSAVQQQGLLWEMVNMVLDGKMPLPSYTAIHPAAKLSQEDIAVLKAYVNGLSPAQYHDTTLIRQAAQQYTTAGAAAPGQSKPIPVAANGVAYQPGFRSWQVISTTNRFDNNRSIRVLYGNAIAAAAVEDNKINPWPQGSVLVKVVWDIVQEKNGDILPGAFNNVQIMIKDNKKFAASGGWGFAKFNGLELKPYGRTAAFNTACYNCHKAASDYDYVFNLPATQ